MQKYNLIVVSPEPFPYGQAATNRLLSYLTGIAENKAVLYLCLAAPSKTPCLNLTKRGIYKKIHYRYLIDPNTTYKQSKLLRAATLILRNITLILSLLCCYTCRSILVYTTDKRIINSVLLVSRLKKNKVFRDITELVGYNYKKDLDAVISMKCDMAKLSGLITISTGIYEYFENLTADKKFLLPVLVDATRFKSVIKKEKYVFVCSGANLERDGLLDSLNGFLLFSKQYPDYVFEIASSLNLNDPYHKRCKDLIDKNSDSIHWLGSLPSYEIPEKMAHASALMLTPHANYKTKGFPTKLGEYLMSATPVICSTIDDLEDIIYQSIVYSVPPNSPSMIADKLQYIISHPIEAHEIGNKARRYMEENYTIKSFKSSLMDFLDI